MPWAELDPDALTLWVFGPGVGELIVVRAPPNDWAIIDGCGIDGQGWAQKLLDHYQARPSLVLLSHPHLDHARGLRDVIERATREDGDSWPALGMVPAPNTEGVGDAWDARAALDGGVVEQTVATILDRWERRPECRWDVDAGSTKSLGDAVVKVLSPTPAARDAAVRAWLERKRHDFNRASTALMVSWRGRKLLLGSDLVEDPGHGWTAAEAHDRSLKRHSLYKVAHHGSRKAIGNQAGRPSRPMIRTWTVTPFAPQGLPRFGDGDGVDQLLALEEPLLLTGLPRGEAAQADRALEATREALRDDPTLGEPNVPTEFPKCFVRLTFRPTGDPEVELGPGALRVRPHS